MRSMSIICATICLLVALCHAAPAPATLNTQDAAAASGNEKEVIEIINLSNFGETARDKRDINMLRQLFPGLASIFDRLVQEIISQSFRVIGRTLLQNGGLGGLLGGLGGGGGGAAGGGGGGGRVSVSLPTFPPDEDEDEDDDSDEADTMNSPSSTSSTLSTAETDNNEENSLSGSESQNNEVRVKFEDDQDTAASNNGPLPVDETNADADADRNKRFLPFGGGLGLGSGSGGGDHGGAAGGGSGNFLFDIIRNTADRAARAAGTVYRMVAGTETLGLGLTATSTQTKTIAPATPASQLVAGSGSGSGGTETGDEKANGPAVGVDVAAGADGYTEGVPGPITRLFVIANRGIANLIQDLILRLAQTSERIVNFKARLVTALI